MIPDEKQQSKLQGLGGSILRALESIAERATNLLVGPSHGTGDVLAVDANPMTGAPLGRHSVGRARAETRRDLRQIAREPFIARVELEWVDDNDRSPACRETIYVTRGSASDVMDAIPGARVVSYRAPLGRIAEFAAGEYAAVSIPGRYSEAEIQQRIRVRPVHRGGQWDGRESSFEFGTWSAALDSIRAFLDELEQAAEPLDEIVPDIIGELLEQADKRTQIREALHRQVVGRMLLRDQPILDRYQGEVFRMPIHRCLLLMGAPGTGKTTTLIKRLAQKRAADGLTEEEEKHLERLGLLSSIQDPSSWVMFSPTELLQLYLRDAFNKESVPAGGGNLKTWDRQRLALGKNVLRILRTADSGRFRLDESTDSLAERTSRGITALQEEFEGYFNEAMFRRARESVKYLRSRGSEVVNGVLDEHLASIENGQVTSPRQLVGILDLAGLQPELQKLQEEIGGKLRRMGSILVRNHSQLLDEMVEALPSILGKGREDDDAEEEDDASDPVTDVREDPRGSDDKRTTCAKLLVAAIRSRCRSLALGRRPPGGRVGRVLKFLDGRLPSMEDMRALGHVVVTYQHLRTLSRFARTLVMGAPAWFNRFRRLKDVHARYYTEAAAKWIDQNRLSAEEVDVIILTMLRNTRLLLESNPGHLSGRSRHDWLEEIKGHYASQVFVDEATDFSAVQLACTLELAHPRLRSWFACGDLNQRITYGGIRSVAEIRELADAAGAQIEVRTISRAYRQSAKLRQLAVALAVAEAETTMEDPGFEDNVGVAPQLMEHCAEASEVEWLASRIGEVETATGRLPSVAVFVHDEGQVDALVEQLRAQLANENVPVVGFKDGRAIGDAAEVRVFDVRHVKGLEFEAVFYLGIDELAKALPDLFERYLFVGVSRAATYLGVTCEDVLPDAMEKVRGHFETGGWAQ